MHKKTVHMYKCNLLSFKHPACFVKCFWGNFEEKKKGFAMLTLTVSINSDWKGKKSVFLVYYDGSQSGVQYPSGGTAWGYTENKIK